MTNAYTKWENEKRDKKKKKKKFYFAKQNVTKNYSNSTQSWQAARKRLSPIKAGHLLHNTTLNRTQKNTNVQLCKNVQKNK